MKRMAEAAAALDRLESSWPRVDGPADPRFRAWLANVTAQLPEIDPAAATRFSHLARYMMMPLSSYTLVPIWNDMLSTIRAAATRVRIELRDRSDKIYAPGDTNEFSENLASIIGSAQRRIFVVEPYAHDRIFSDFFCKADAEISIHLLTKQPTPGLCAAAATFAGSRAGPFEVRKSSNIHDRTIFVDNDDCWVLGQSMKDAAKRMPTYLLPVVAVTDMVKLYEELWAKAIAL